MTASVVSTEIEVIVNNGQWQHAPVPHFVNRIAPLYFDWVWSAFCNN